MEKCPNCGSSELIPRETVEGLTCMECIDCSIPDFFVDEDGKIWYDGEQYETPELFIEELHEEGLLNEES